MNYYVDTSIWLNLFKKEGDETKGKPYWKIAEEFIDKARKGSSIIVSAFVIKELSYKLGKSFDQIKKEIRELCRYAIIKATESDYNLSRKIEFENNFKIGFYDCMHITLTKRLNCILVTRDADLIMIGNKYVKTDKPENLIS